MTLHAIRPSRRAFLAGAGLVIGFAVAPSGFAARAVQGRRRPAATARCRS